MNHWKMSTFVLAGCLAMGVVYETASTASAADQPKMAAALASLGVAKTNLQGATTDKGGFRVKALQNVNDAIENTKKGIEWDNTHQSADEKKK